MSDLQSASTLETSSRRRMQVVAERVVADPEPAGITTTAPTTTSSISSQTTTSSSDELIARAAWQRGVFAAFSVAIKILAARAILLFAVLGAIGLAVLAISGGDYPRLAVLGLYTITVCGPLVWLAGKS